MFCARNFCVLSSYTKGTWKVASGALFPYSWFLHRNFHLQKNDDRSCSGSSHCDSEGSVLATFSPSPSCSEKSNAFFSSKIKTPPPSGGSSSTVTSPPPSAFSSSVSPRFQNKNIKPKRAFCPLPSIEPSPVSSATHVTNTTSLRAGCPLPNFSAAVEHENVKEQRSAAFSSLHSSLVSKESSSLHVESVADPSPIQPLCRTHSKVDETPSHTSSTFFQSLSSDLPAPPGTSRLYCSADGFLGKGKSWETPATNHSSASASLTADDEKHYRLSTVRPYPSPSLSSPHGSGLSSDGICSYLSTLQRVYKSSKRHLPTQRVTFEAAWSYLQDLLPTQVKHEKSYAKDIGRSTSRLSSSSFITHPEKNVIRASDEGEKEKRLKSSVDSSPNISAEQVEWTSLMALSVIGTVGVFGFPISTVPIVKDAIQFLLHPPPLSSFSSRPSGEKVDTAVSTLPEGKKGRGREEENTAQKEYTAVDRGREEDIEMDSACVYDQGSQQECQNVQEGHDDMPEALKWAQLTLLVQRLLQKEKNNRMLASQLYLSHDEDDVEPQLGSRHRRSKESSIAVSPSHISSSSVSAESGQSLCAESSPIPRTTSSLPSSGQNAVFSASVPPSDALSDRYSVTEDSRKTPLFRTAKASEERSEETPSRFPSWQASLDDDGALHKERPLLLFCHASSSRASNVGATTRTSGLGGHLERAPLWEEESLLMKLYVTVLLPRMMRQLRRLLRPPLAPPSPSHASLSSVPPHAKEEREKAVHHVEERKRVGGDAYKTKSGKEIPSWNRLELEVFSSTLSVLQKAVAQHLVAPFSLAHVQQFLSTENEKKNDGKSNEKKEGEGEKDEDQEKSIQRSRMECIIFCSAPLHSSTDAQDFLLQQGGATFVSTTLEKIPLADFIYGMQRCLVAVRSLFSSSLERSPREALADTLLPKTIDSETTSASLVLHKEDNHRPNDVQTDSCDGYVQNASEQCETDDAKIPSSLSSSISTPNEAYSRRRFTSRRGGSERGEKKLSPTPLSHSSNAPLRIPPSLTGAPNVNHDILQPILLFSTHSSALDLFFSKRSKVPHSSMLSFASSGPSPAASHNVSQLSMASTKTPAPPSSSSFPLNESKDIEKQELFLCWKKLQHCIFTLLRWSSECIPLMRTRHLAALATTCARMVHPAVGDDGAMRRCRLPPPSSFSSTIAPSTAESTAPTSLSRASSTFVSGSSPSLPSETIKNVGSVLPTKEGRASHTLPFSSLSRTPSGQQKAPHVIFSSAWFTKRLALSLLLGHPFSFFADDSTFLLSEHREESEEVLWIRNALFTIFNSLCRRAIEVKHFFSSSDTAAFLKGLSGFACSWRWRCTLLQEHQYCSKQLREGEKNPFFPLHIKGQSSHLADEDGGIEVLVQDTITSVVSQLEWFGYSSSRAIGLILVYHSNEKVFLTISKRIPRYIAKAAGHSSSASQSALTIAEYCTIQESLEKLTPVLPDVWLQVLGKLLNDTYFHHQPSDVVQYLLRSMYRHSMHSLHFGPQEGSNAALERTIEQYMPYFRVNGNSETTHLSSSSSSPLSSDTGTGEMIASTTSTSDRNSSLSLSQNHTDHSAVPSPFSPLYPPFWPAGEGNHTAGHDDDSPKDEDDHGSRRRNDDVAQEEGKRERDEIVARSRSQHILRCLCYLLQQENVNHSQSRSSLSPSRHPYNEDQRKEEEEMTVYGPSSPPFSSGNKHPRGTTISASQISLSFPFCEIPTEVLESFLQDHLDEHMETYQAFVRDTCLCVPSILSLEKVKETLTIDGVVKSRPKAFHYGGRNEKRSTAKPEEKGEEVNQFAADNEKETIEAGAEKQCEAHFLALLAKEVELLVLSARFAPEVNHKMHSHREKLIFHACGYFLEYFCFFSSFPVSKPENLELKTIPEKCNWMLQKPLLWRNHSPFLHRVLLALTVLSRWNLFEGLRTRQAEAVADGAGVEGRTHYPSWSSVRMPGDQMQSKQAKGLGVTEKKVEEMDKVPAAQHPLLDDQLPFIEGHCPSSFSNSHRSKSTVKELGSSSIAASSLTPLSIRTHRADSRVRRPDDTCRRALMCRVLTHLLSLFLSSGSLVGSGSPCAMGEGTNLTEEDEASAAADSLFFLTLANVSSQVSEMEAEVSSGVVNNAALAASPKTLFKQRGAHTKDDERNGVDSIVPETEVEKKESVVCAVAPPSSLPVSLSSTPSFPLLYANKHFKRGYLQYFHPHHGNHCDYCSMFFNEFFDRTVREAFTVLVSRSPPVISTTTTEKGKKNTSSESAQNSVSADVHKLCGDPLLLSRSASPSSSSSSVLPPFLFRLAHFFSVPVSYSLLNNSAQQCLFRLCRLPEWFVELPSWRGEVKGREWEDVHGKCELHGTPSPWRSSVRGGKIRHSTVGKNEKEKVGVRIASETHNSKENTLQTGVSHELQTSAFSSTLFSAPSSTLSSSSNFLNPSECSSSSPTLLQWALVPWMSGVLHYSPPPLPSFSSGFRLEATSTSPPLDSPLSASFRESERARMEIAEVLHEKVSDQKRKTSAEEEDNQWLEVAEGWTTPSSLASKESWISDTRLPGIYLSHENDTGGKECRMCAAASDFQRGKNEGNIHRSSSTTRKSANRGNTFGCVSPFSSSALDGSSSFIGLCTYASDLPHRRSRSDLSASNGVLLEDDRNALYAGNRDSATDDTSTVRKERIFFPASLSCLSQLLKSWAVAFTLSTSLSPTPMASAEESRASSYVRDCSDNMYLEKWKRRSVLNALCCLLMKQRGVSSSSVYYELVHSFRCCLFHSSGLGRHSGTTSLFLCSSFSSLQRKASVVEEEDLVVFFGSLLEILALVRQHPSTMFYTCEKEPMRLDRKMEKGKRQASPNTAMAASLQTNLDNSREGNMNFRSTFLQVLEEIIWECGESLREFQDKTGTTFCDGQTIFSSSALKSLGYLLAGIAALPISSMDSVAANSFGAPSYSGRNNNNNNNNSHKELSGVHGGRCSSGAEQEGNNVGSLQCGVHASFSYNEDSSLLSASYFLHLLVRPYLQAMVTAVEATQQCRQERSASFSSPTSSPLSERGGRVLVGIPPTSLLQYLAVLDASLLSLLLRTQAQGNHRRFGQSMKYPRMASSTSLTDGTEKRKVHRSDGHLQTGAFDGSAYLIATPLDCFLHVLLHLNLPETSSEDEMRALDDDEDEERSIDEDSHGNKMVTSFPSFLPSHSNTDGSLDDQFHHEKQNKTSVNSSLAFIPPLLGKKMQKQLSRQVAQGVLRQQHVITAGNGNENEGKGKRERSGEVEEESEQWGMSSVHDRTVPALLPSTSAALRYQQEVFQKERLFKCLTKLLLQPHDFSCATPVTVGRLSFVLDTPRLAQKSKNLKFRLLQLLFHCVLKKGIDIVGTNMTVCPPSSSAVPSSFQRVVYISPIQTMNSSFSMLHSSDSHDHPVRSSLSSHPSCASPRLTAPPFVMECLPFISLCTWCELLQGPRPLSLFWFSALRKEWISSDRSYLGKGGRRQDYAPGTKGRGEWVGGCGAALSLSPCEADALPSTRRIDTTHQRRTTSFTNTKSTAMPRRNAPSAPSPRRSPFLRPMDTTVMRNIKFHHSGFLFLIFLELSHLEEMRVVLGPLSLLRLCNHVLMYYVERWVGCVAEEGVAFLDEQRVAEKRALELLVRSWCGRDHDLSFPAFSFSPGSETNGNGQQNVSEGQRGSSVPFSSPSMKIEEVENIESSRASDGVERMEQEKTNFFAPSWMIYHSQFKTKRECRKHEKKEKEESSSSTNFSFPYHAYAHKTRLQGIHLWYAYAHHLLCSLVFDNDGCPLTPEKRCDIIYSVAQEEHHARSTFHQRRQSLLEFTSSPQDDFRVAFQGESQVKRSSPKSCLSSSSSSSVILDVSLLLETMKLLETIFYDGSAVMEEAGVFHLEAEVLEWSASSPLFQVQRKMNNDGHAVWSTEQSDMPQRRALNMEVTKGNHKNKDAPSDSTCVKECRTHIDVDSEIPSRDGVNVKEDFRMSCSTSFLLSLFRIGSDLRQKPSFPSLISVVVTNSSSILSYWRGCIKTMQRRADDFTESMDGMFSDEIHRVQEKVVGEKQCICAAVVSPVTLLVIGQRLQQVVEDTLQYTILQVPCEGIDASGDVNSSNSENKAPTTAALTNNPMSSYEVVLRSSLNAFHISDIVTLFALTVKTFLNTAFSAERVPLLLLDDENSNLNHSNSSKSEPHEYHSIAKRRGRKSVFHVPFALSAMTNMMEEYLSFMSAEDIIRSTCFALNLHQKVEIPLDFDKVVKERKEDGETEFFIPSFTSGEKTSSNSAPLWKDVDVRHHDMHVRHLNDISSLPEMKREVRRFLCAVPVVCANDVERFQPVELIFLFTSLFIPSGFSACTEKNSPSFATSDENNLDQNGTSTQKTRKDSLMFSSTTLLSPNEKNRPIDFMRMVRHHSLVSGETARLVADRLIVAYGLEHTNWYQKFERYRQILPYIRKEKYSLFFRQKFSPKTGGFSEKEVHVEITEEDQKIINELKYFDLDSYFGRLDALYNNYLHEFSPSLLRFSSSLLSSVFPIEISPPCSSDVGMPRRNTQMTCRDEERSQLYHFLRFLSFIEVVNQD